MASDLESLDPLTSSGSDTLIVLRQVFETLVDLEPGGYRVVPKLAERWTVSADALTWTFTLRAGVRFHDGTPLDAAAVAFDLERARSSAGPGLAAILASTGAPDASTVVLTLRSPFAPLLATLAMPSLGIASPACIKQGPSWARPASRCAAGTGPFVLEAGAWQVGQRVALTRNAAYWGTAADGLRLPYLDGITFQPVPDEATRVGALKAATTDVALDLGPAGVKSLRSDPNVAPAYRPAFDASYLGVGIATRPFDVVDVRRAVAMAVDRGAILQTVYGGEARAATQLVPPGLLGYDDSVTQFSAQDTTAARRLLADAGFASGFTTEIWYATEPLPALPDPRRVAEGIAADLAKIGITAAVRSEDATAFAADARAGTLPLWIGTRTPARADADDFLFDATASAVAQELLRRARGEVDESKRSELYKQVTKLVQQEITRIPLFNAGASLGLSRKVQGVVPQPVVGESFMSVWFGR